MLLKAVKETYGRHLSAPTSDPILIKLPSVDQEERFRRNEMIAAQLFRAAAFVIEPAALDLVATVQAGVKFLEDFGPLLAETPLPFETVWFEFSEEIDGGRSAAGVLITRVAGKLLVCSFHRYGSEPIIEPLLMLSVDGNGKLDIRADPYTSPRFVNGYEGAHDEKVSRFFGDAFPQTGWAILNVVGAMHLIAAKGGPLDAEAEPMFSRPERRRLEREGALAPGAAPTVTKIRINEQGRLHLQAVDDEEGGPGGARRRAHRVRGHYMRTAKGSSWRKAHVRGLGAVNETVRVVSTGPGTSADS